MALSIAQRVQSLDPQAEAAARLIAEESLRLYDAMHGIIPRLTPLVLDNFGLADALADLVERTQRSQADVQVALEVALGAAVLPAEVSLALYRAAQEGMTNAMRHGQAHRLTLAVRGRADQVTLELIDDGVGLAGEWSQKTGHHGLRWLAERTQSLGASFEIAPAVPRGVRLQVRLPLSADAMASASDASATATANATAPGASSHDSRHAGR